MTKKYTKKQSRLGLLGPLTRFQLKPLVLGVLASVQGVAMAASPSSCHAGQQSCLPIPFAHAHSVPDVADLPKPFTPLFVQPQPVGQLIRRKNLDGALGWVPVYGAADICGGYFIEPQLVEGHTRLKPVNQSPIRIVADKSRLSNVKRSVLQGNVDIQQPGRSIHADQVFLNRDPKTKQFTAADAFGHLYVREPGLMMVGDRGHLNLQQKTGEVWPVIYRMSYKNEAKKTAAANKPNTQVVKDYSLNAWGSADKLYRSPDGIVHIKSGNLSTCPPSNVTWKVSSSQLNLNKTSGRGSAYNSLLYLHDIPVFYLPYINFPIDDRRQTGFLYPTFGYEDDSGYFFSTPFYWNIAPNYDATITPKYFSERGLQMNGLFRYLTDKSQGQVDTSIIFNDREFSSFQDSAPSDYPNASTSSLNDLEGASDTRGAFSWKNTTNFNEHWQGDVDYNWVSDDNYLEDFATDVTQSTDDQLLQQADLQYKGQIWHIQGKVQGYQTLNPVDQSDTDDQYSRLPELDADAHYTILSDAVSLNWQSQFVNFDHNDEIDPNTGFDYMTGQRWHMEPGVTWAKNWVSGYVKPNVKLWGTQDDLQNPNPGDPANPGVVVPIFDLDTGLFFDRNTTLWGGDYDQTLEPRLFYLFVPNAQQNDLANFDTYPEVFNYDQLFATNRFAGNDRIGDANQVSLALTTRFLDAETGVQRFRASVGEILYFRNRDVTYCEPGPGQSSCVDQDNDPIIDTLSDTSAVSPIASQMSFRMSQHWNGIANWAWDPSKTETNNGSVNVRYKPAPKKVFNVGYDFVRGGDPLDLTPSTLNPPPDSYQNDLSQSDISAAWPLSDRWSAIGRWNYNVSHTHNEAILGGLQYDSCCWAVRVVYSRYYTGIDSNNQDEYSKGIYIQWYLKGLGALGSGTPKKTIEDAIPGYTDRFGTLS